QPPEGEGTAPAVGGLPESGLAPGRLVPARSGEGPRGLLGADGEGARLDGPLVEGPRMGPALREVVRGREAEHVRELARQAPQGSAAEQGRGRAGDAESHVSVTADGGYRRGTVLPLKKIVDEAIADLDVVRHVVVFRRTGAEVPMREGRDHWWHDLMAKAAAECEPEAMNATDPLFILYTSGTTGKPKGIQHSTGGYLVGVATTMKYVFDLKDEDLYWCTADIGWVTGHSYIVYGPLANGASVFMY